MPHKNIIDLALQKLKQSNTIQELFEEYDVSIKELDYIPISFKEDLDVSARTEHGIIYLNSKLLDKTNEVPPYLAHELRHFLQQTTGSHPTQGSDDGDYLDNTYEIEGFQTQTEFLSETEGDDVAEKYISKVLDFHDVPKKEQKERKKELLQLASKQLQLSEPPLHKTQQELMKEYDQAVERGPQGKYTRTNILNRKIPSHQQKYMLERLQQILKLIDQNQNNPQMLERLERRKQMLQTLLKFNE